jgi:hypothetical protein
MPKIKSSSPSLKVHAGASQLLLERVFVIKMAVRIPARQSMSLIPRMVLWNWRLLPHSQVVRNLSKQDVLPVTMRPNTTSQYFVLSLKRAHLSLLRMHLELCCR